MSKVAENNCEQLLDTTLTDGQLSSTTEDAIYDTPSKIKVPIIDLHGISVTAPYPYDQVHAVFDAGYFTLAPPTKVAPEVQQHPMWDIDST
jgi:hypothetical protein